tara:strand:- start:438 stop:845 length:408 start_codon:yes stop_codon:yes gene_type:complete
MSGCFDDAVGEAEGAGNDSTDTEDSHMYHIYTESSERNVANISVNSNQILEIVSATMIIVYDDNYSNNNPVLRSLGVTSASCYSGDENALSFYDRDKSDFVWKSDGPCEYTIGHYLEENYGTAYSSIVYRIHNVL